MLLLFESKEVRARDAVKRRKKGKEERKETRGKRLCRFFFSSAFVLGRTKTTWLT
jgi:hypothetical protein